MSTLSFERGTAFTAGQVQLSAIVEDLVEEARTRTGPDGRRPAIADDEVARRLAAARAECAALRAITYLGVSRNRRQPQPGPEGSMLKLLFSEVEQRVYRLAMDILDPVDASGDDGDGRRWHADYLQAFSTPIAGGTSEIQRNIIGERVLGLPR
jgi:alkylation response protein AidB-like acyl-CoA dehydrogenase